MMGGGGGSALPSLVMYNREEKGYEKMSSGTLTNTLQVQDLRVLHLYYVGFAGPHFMRAPADARENGLWNAQPFPLPSYDVLMKGLPYGDPAGTLRNVDARVPSVMKNPPEPREFDKFKKYLKDNAPPNILAKINSGLLSVNMAANLRSPLEIVACRTYPETAKGKDEKEFSIGHWAILTNGTWRYAQPAEIGAFLGAPPAEKKEMGMPGMPGMPK